jgi:hypothetical protein
MGNQEIIEHNFSYHAPNQEKKELHTEIRATLGQVARYFDELLPDGREKSLVLTKLEEAMFWANAAIARNNND